MIHAVTWQRLARFCKGALVWVIKKLQHGVEVSLMHLVRVLSDRPAQCFAPRLNNNKTLLWRHHLLKRVRQLMANCDGILYAT